MPSQARRRHPRPAQGPKHPEVLGSGAPLPRPSMTCAGGRAKRRVTATGTAFRQVPGCHPLLSLRPPLRYPGAMSSYPSPGHSTDLEITVSQTVVSPASGDENRIRFPEKTSFIFKTNITYETNHPGPSSLCLPMAPPLDKPMARGKNYPPREWTGGPRPKRSPSSRAACPGTDAAQGWPSLHDQEGIEGGGKTFRTCRMSPSASRSSSTAMTVTATRSSQG